jgi:phospholipid/cholesterol/gamma-HCH transport system ATP-binding protein
MRRFGFGKSNKDRSEDWGSMPSWSAGSEAGPPQGEPTGSVPPPSGGGQSQWQPPAPPAPSAPQPPAPAEPQAPAQSGEPLWSPSTDAWASGPDDPAPVHHDPPAQSQPLAAQSDSPGAPSEPPAGGHLTPAATSFEAPAVPEPDQVPQAATPEPAATAAAASAAGGEPDIEWETPARASAGSQQGEQQSAQQSAGSQAGRADRGGDRPGDSGGSRVSVVDEKPPRPAPPDGATEEEYKWHTYKVYPSGRPDAVEFIDTYKAFGKNRILRGLNMGLPEGMVSMILGPSGTGKSVCIKHMVGLLYPDEGDVLVHGQSVPNMADDDLFEMRKKFGLLFQDGALFGSMNLYDNVAFPLRQHTEKGEDEIEDIVMRRLNEVGLGHSRDKMPNELSGGMRKRAGFARALVLGPDIVLFDEPDSGLDPVRTALLGELILEIHRDMMEEAKAAQKQHLPTFAVITHDIMSARRVADYINVLWKGRIVEAGPAEDMLNSENPFIRQFLAGESQGPLTMD